MDVITQLDSILEGVSRVASGVRPDQFDNPTPCAQFVVRDLFDHMIGGASHFAPQLRGESPAGAIDPATLSDAERPAVLRGALDDLLDAAKSPGALGQTVEVPFGAVPGEVLARFLTIDGMVHTWDIAVSTGQAYAPDDALANTVLGTARELIAAGMRDGDTFGSETAVPDDASPITRLVAFTGRAVAS
jgi:uncharacterized protein (TIGR03086 family)